MLLDAIVFDFDGVLVDSVNIKEKIFGALYVEYGEEVVKKVMEHHRCNGGISRFDKFRYYHQEYLGIILLPDDIDYLNKKFSKLVMKLVINADEMPGVEQTLISLHHLLSLHVISATPEAELEQIIVARQMRHFFSSIHGSPQKKSSHIINIIEQNGYEKRRVLMIGDTMTDYESAVEAGIDFLGYVPVEGNNVFPEYVPIISDMRVLMERI
jgi:phosphoglycolate phosphatase-like HAD superfamily hydrolase